MNIRPLEIPGCAEIVPRIIGDERGRFVKVIEPAAFAAHGLENAFIEQYHSSSTRGVLRGLHFQRPPHDHAKLVYCVSGEVLDAVVDLRVGSPTYGRHLTLPLSAERSNAIFVPRGLAHGFYVTSEHATVVCCMSSGYAPESDASVRWDSAGIAWPDLNPLLSPRDAVATAVGDFESPFRYAPSGHA